jgi:2-phospho-L-lactate/phosphoenolpyruvate guanylyltransferase
LVKVALLPAKALPLAKTRLGSMLGDDERMAIACAMFGDVLHALSTASGLDAVIVVTADATLAARARRVGATVVDEGAPRGLNGAVSLGTDVAIQMGATSVLVLLSDIPLVRATDVTELLARAPQHGALLVPSKEGTGTNAMLRQPPTVFPPHFGGRSLERHVAAATRHQLACEIVRSARIGFDLDTPEDLRAFAAHENATETYREVIRIGAAALRSSA